VGATTVQFTDESTGNPTSWAWDFNGDEVIDSAMQNPTHTYSAVGSFTVTLYLTATDCQDKIAKPNYITITPPPTATPTPLANAWIGFGLRKNYVNGDDDIYLIGSDGQNKRQLTNSPSLEWLDCWSPNGEKILFESNQNGNSDIYVMNNDDTNVIRLTDSPVNELQASWSPDGAKIAFVQFNNDINGQFVGDIWAMNADGSSKMNLTDSTVTELCPRWSPDGSKIAYVGYYNDNFQIYTMDSNGNNKTRLTDTGNNYYPIWSPDSSKIAFVSEHNGNAEIYIMASNGSQQTRLTTNTVTGCYPSFSPNGAMIAFYSEQGEDIWVVNTDGSNLRDLTNSPQTYDYPCVSVNNYSWTGKVEQGTAYGVETKGEFTEWRWLPDGNHIAFVSNDNQDGTYSLKVIQLSGVNEATLFTSYLIQPCIVSPVLSASYP
jgi:Tol biopolymer transport system component